MSLGKGVAEEPSASPEVEEQDKGSLLSGVASRTIHFTKQI